MKSLIGILLIAGVIILFVLVAGIMAAKDTNKPDKE